MVLRARLSNRCALVGRMAYLYVPTDLIVALILYLSSDLRPVHYVCCEETWVTLVRSLSTAAPGLSAYRSRSYRAENEQVPPMSVSKVSNFLTLQYPTAIVEE